MTVLKLKVGVRLQLVVRELYAEVVPGESTLKVLRSKILLTLKKADEKKAWSKLSA